MSILILLQLLPFPTACTQIPQIFFFTICHSFTCSWICPFCTCSCLVPTSAFSFYTAILTSRVSFDNLNCFSSNLLALTGLLRPLILEERYIRQYIKLFFLPFWKQKLFSDQFLSLCWCHLAHKLSCVNILSLRLFFRIFIKIFSRSVLDYQACLGLSLWSTPCS